MFLSRNGVWLTGLVNSKLKCREPGGFVIGSAGGLYLWGGLTFETAGGRPSTTRQRGGASHSVSADQRASIQYRGPSYTLSRWPHLVLFADHISHGVLGACISMSIGNLSKWSKKSCVKQVTSGSLRCLC